MNAINTHFSKSLVKPIIAPSILACDFANLESECKKVLSKGADWLHIDIMDGHFVNNIAVGYPVIKSLRKKLPNTFFDCHCMIEDPMKYVIELSESGASQMTFHLESSIESLDKLIYKIKDNNMKVGLAIKPKTLLEDYTIDKFVNQGLIDMFLVMTVEPGFGGQKFNEDCLVKVKKIKENYPWLNIQVDGGVKLENVDLCTKSGANVIVSGTGIFGKDNYESIMHDMRQSILNNCCNNK